LYPSPNIIRGENKTELVGRMCWTHGTDTKCVNSFSKKKSAAKRPFVRPGYRKININLDLKISVRMRTGFIWLKMQSSGRLWDFIKER
jgi:hypothetical protein